MEVEIRTCIVLLVVAALAFGSAPVEAKGKKGRLNEALTVTRRDIVEIVRPESTEFVDVDGLTLNVTLDHEAVVVCHGVVVAAAANGYIEFGVSVDGVADPEPLIHFFTTTNVVSLPVLRSVTLSPGTHVLKVQMRSVLVEGTPTPGLFVSLRHRRFVGLVY